MSLPVLASAFLTNHPPSRELFAKYLGQGPWGPSCIPVYEWQGILYIACADPELISENKPENWCYVKSEEAILSPLFKMLSENQLSSNFATDAEQISPEKPQMRHPSTQISDLMDLGEFESKEPEKQDESIETLDFSSEDERRTGTAIKSESNLDLSDLKLVPDGQKLKNEEVLKQPNLAHESLSTRTEPVNPESTPSQSSIQPPAFVQDDEWSKIWNGLSGHFQNSMICLIQQNEIIPWKWDPSLINPETEPQVLSLKIPSPFRIIARTGRPYHGAPVPNPVSDEFFKRWAQGKYPEHLTGVPLFKNQGLLGFLICWGNQSSANKDSLHVCEAFAKQASQLIKKQIEESKSDPTAA